MGTISAKKITDALAKAKNVGIVEEEFTLDDCSLTLRNLRPDEYTAVLQECKELEELDYLYGYEKGHVSRAVVEINGLSFRDVEFIEVEEEDAQKPGKTKTVKLELHAYIRRTLLDSWSKEAIFTAYRKFGDVVKKAEDKAKAGITFIIPEESAEDKFRRVLGELKDIEDEIPSVLIDKVLDDYGFMRKSTAAEIKSAMEKADKLAREAEAAAETEQPPPDEEDSGTPPPAATAPAAPPPPQAPPPAAPPVAAAPTSEDLMARRQPLNRAAMPVDPHNIQARLAQAQAHQPPATTPGVLTKAAEYAALETDAGLAVHPELTNLPGPGEAPIPVSPPQREEVAELRARGQEAVDAKAFHQIVEKGPSAGINPRYRPPSRA
jgi:hypothetical protein